MSKLSEVIEQYGIDVEAFNALKDSGATPDELKMHLITTCDIPFSKVPMVYKELGGSKGRKAGFTKDFYEWLKGGPRTMEEVELFCKNNGSQNVKRQISHYQGIAELTNSIHNQ